MNPNTNHLVRTDMDAKLPDGYVEIPKDLHHAALVKLRGELEATISRTSGGKLSKFAEACRKHERLKKLRILEAQLAALDKGE